MNRPVATALRCSLIFLVSAVAYADSAQWNLNTVSGDWNTAGNWTPMTVPNGPADIATFGLSNTTNVSISANTEVDGITFTSAATNPYSIDVGNESTLTLSGTGITDNSGIPQYFAMDLEALLQFSNTSTAGSANTRIQNGGGVIYFSNTSTAGSANILNVGAMDFFDSSTAGSANIAIDVIAFTQFLNTSTAGSATFETFGLIFFNESSKGGTARIELLDDFSSEGPGFLDISVHNPRA